MVTKKAVYVSPGQSITVTIGAGGAGAGAGTGSGASGYLTVEW
jgi:hypothetical protein